MMKQFYQQIFLYLLHNKNLTVNECDILMAHVAGIIGRTFEETQKVHAAFSEKNNPNRFFQIIYWLGRLAISEIVDNNKRAISFSPVLRERIGHHFYGEIWANSIKTILNEKEIGVQVNGKLRGSIVVSIDDSEDVIKDKALNNDNVKRHIEGLEIVKVIVIKGRIVNIVVK